MTAKFTRDAAIAAYAAQRASAHAALIAGGIAAPDVDALIAAGRDVIALRTRAATADDLAPGATRLGGLPDLPAGAAWPARDDYAFEFVGQLALAELAALDVHDLLPHDGVLSLFAGHDKSPDSTWQLAHRVQHYRDGALIAAPGDTATRAKHLRPPKPRGVAFEPVYFLPPAWSPWLPRLTCTRGYAAAYDSIYQLTESPRYPASGLLGFDRANEEALAPAERMLLRLDADEQIPYLFHESVTLCFVVAPDALAAWDLGRVRAFEGASI